MTVRLTKLRPPVAHLGVPRAELLRKLDERCKRVTVVCAPAGFGKTTLLRAAWNERRDRDQAHGWLSCDAGDNDVVTFVNHLLHCLQSALPGFGQTTVALLDAGLTPPAGSLATALQNDLLTRDPAFQLFLDDFHVVSNPEVVELVYQLLSAPLTAFQVVIAMRSHATFPLARLRVQGALEELTAEHLKFSLADTKVFLRAATGIALSEDDMAMLHARTEGWIAGLQLAAIALDSGKLSACSVREFAGDHRDVTDFLAAEVFRAQPPEVQSFLEVTAVLPRFCARLCDALTARHDAADLLDQLQRANLFIFALDLQGVWFRFHHLFSDFLIARLRRRAPALERELHTRAAHWFVAEGEAQEAIEHALAGHDQAFAATMLDRCSRDLFAGGRTASLKRYVAELPAALCERLPRLQLVRAWDLALSWNFDAAEAALCCVRAYLDESADGAEAGRHEIESLYWHRRAMLDVCSDRLEAARDGARDWLARWALDDVFMHAAANTVILLAEREQYVLEITDERAEALGAQCRAGGAPYGEVFVNSVIGRTYCAMGDLARAEATLRHARAAACTLHGSDSGLAAMPSAHLAEVLYEMNALDAARELLGVYRDGGPQFGFIDTLLSFFLTRARIALADDDKDEAERCLVLGEAMAERRRLPRLTAHLEAERVRLSIQRGDPDAAARAPARLGVNAASAARMLPRTGVTMAQEAAVLACARLARARHLPQPWLPVLAAWVRYATRRGAWRSAIRLAVELALLRAQAGEDAGAYRTLKEALDWARARGFVRVFLDEGPDMAKLLEGFVARVGTTDPSGVRGQARGLLALFNRDHAVACSAPADPDDAGEFRESMTGREVEILTLALEGYVNREIAAHLVLSEATVKWYWRRILRKMGVARRAQALRMARRWGIHQRA